MGIYSLAVEDAEPNGPMEDAILASSLDDCIDRLAQLEEETPGETNVSAETYKSPEELKVALEGIVGGLIALLIAAMAAAIVFIMGIISKFRKSKDPAAMSKELNKGPMVWMKMGDSVLSADTALERLVTKCFDNSEMVDSLYASLGAQGIHFILRHPEAIREYGILKKALDNDSISDFRKMWDVYNRATQDFLSSQMLNADAEGQDADASDYFKQMAASYQDLQQRLDAGFGTWGKTSDLPVTELLPLDKVLPALKAYDFSSSDREIRWGECDADIKKMVNTYAHAEADLKKVETDFNRLKQSLERVKQRTGGKMPPDANEVFRLIGQLRNTFTAYIRFNDHAMSSALALHNASMRTYIAIFQFRERALKQIKQDGTYKGTEFLDDVIKSCAATIKEARSRMIAIPAHS